AAVSNCSVAVAESETRAAPIDANPSSAVSGSSSVLIVTPGPRRSAIVLRYCVVVSRRSVDGAGENAAAGGGLGPSSPFGCAPGGIRGTGGARATLVVPAARVPPAGGGAPPPIRPRAHPPARATSPASTAASRERSVTRDLLFGDQDPRHTPEGS